MSTEKLIAEVDSIVGHIERQVQFGTDRDEVTAEHATLLLQTFSKLSGISRDTANTVSNHISRTGVSNLIQLSSFTACLRAAIGIRLHQPGNSSMQTMYIEHALIQADWDRLWAHPKIDVLDMCNIVANRMHRYGVVCPDAATSAHQSPTAERKIPPHQQNTIYY